MHTTYYLHSVTRGSGLYLPPTYKLWLHCPSCFSVCNDILTTRHNASTEGECRVSSVGVSCYLPIQVGAGMSSRPDVDVYSDNLLREPNKSLIALPLFSLSILSLASSTSESNTTTSQSLFSLSLSESGPSALAGVQVMMGTERVGEAAAEVLSERYDPVGDAGESRILALDCC
jgi:hypothetical protein